MAQLPAARRASRDDRPCVEPPAGYLHRQGLSSHCGRYMRNLPGIGDMAHNGTVPVSAGSFERHDRMMPQAVAGTRLVRDTATGVDAPWPVFDRVALAPLGCLAERAIIAEDERRLPRSVRAGCDSPCGSKICSCRMMFPGFLSPMPARDLVTTLKRLVSWTSSGNTGALVNFRAEHATPSGLDTRRRASVVVCRSFLGRGVRCHRRGFLPVRRPGMTLLPAMPGIDGARSGDPASRIEVNVSTAPVTR